jgi:hypothetical protein
MDVSTALELVEADVRNAFGEQLPDGEGFDVDRDFDGWRDAPFETSDHSKVVVPWTWGGRNSGLLGLDATNRDVLIHGITVIEEDGGSFLCRRYVDWLPALGQAGILLDTRPIRPIDERYGPGELSAIPEYEEALEEIARVRAELPDA